MDPALDVFLTHRARLFGIAYRVTGEVSGAEDLVQEAWLRWQRTDHAKVENPAAFLTTTTANLAINVIQSARRRHETPTASLQEHIVDLAEDPVGQTLAVEEILALLMARLTPAELAAYLLRKGFDYAYPDIAGLLQTSVANARQLVRRAQTRMSGARRVGVDPVAHRRLVAAFLTAARTGEFGGLEEVLGGRCAASCVA